MSKQKSEATKGEQSVAKDSKQPSAGGGHSHNHSHAANQNLSRLAWAMVIIGVVLVFQIIGGLISGSLSLLADAGHMASDLIGLAIALVAVVISKRPANDRQSFGFRRFEVFGAMFNGFLLLILSITIAFQAVSRLIAASQTELEIDSVPMLVVAIIGLLANIAALLILQTGNKESINLRGAYLEVMADTLGSVAVIVAAVVIWVTGFVQADAIASLLIAVFIFPRALSLLKEVFSILNQASPSDTDLNLLREHLLSAKGVIALHDLHIWSITGGEKIFSAHVVVEEQVFTDGKTGELLSKLNECLSNHFDVEHSTIQFEPEGHQEPSEALHS